jgi:hypothetical protein
MQGSLVGSEMCLRDRNRAPAPMAVFVPPLSLKSAPAPTAVSRLASLRLSSEYVPIPVLYMPVVRL